MTPPIVIELGFRGIHIPPQARQARTTCPECSPYRTKRDEPCLRVRLHGQTRAEVYCFHCDSYEEIEA